MEDKNWDLVIRPKNEDRIFDIKELLRYKDLLLLFVKRDFISLYKQTVLGPIWVIVQPVLTTITFFIVFTKIAAIDTGAVPPLLFYMIGVTVWTYFADCVLKTSDTFIQNQNIFGKVYFPRIIVPLSVVLTNLIKFGIQFVLFVLVYLVYYFYTKSGTPPQNWGVSIHLLLIPLLVFIMAMMGLGIGLIISALTTKYRDLRFLIQFGIQLAMYATPVVWPLKAIPVEHQWKLALNPMTSIVESFKTGFFGIDSGVFNWWFLGYSAVFSVVFFLIGFRLFTRVEKSFMDTI